MTRQTSEYPSPRSARKGFSILSLIIITALVVAVSGCSRKEEPGKKEEVRPAKIMTIKPIEATRLLKFPGKVRGLDRVKLAFEVSGRLIEMAVREGQHVNQGDLIARIDPTDYKSELAAQQARVAQAKAEADRYANLLQAKVVAKSTYDVKRRNYEVALSAMKIALKAYNDTKLKASFEGIIGRRFVDNYKMVRVNEPIVSLQRLSAIEVVVNLPENVIRKRAAGATLKISAEFANYPGERLPLTVKEYAVEADPQTQTYQVVLIMPMPKDKIILDGMTATVFIEIVDAAKGVIEVPVQSIFYDENKQAYVWQVGDDFHITRRPVTVGTMTNQGNILIKSGLAAGDRIVTAGVQTLTEGLKVREFTGTVGE